ncbi:hypothetical protein JD969_13210 [Planctomycetota bacterium]|nr:hypothetical protein JD969_13210 [Planctomycetota bacterium]
MAKSLGTGDITLFTLPRAYLGQDAIVQENAIRSWRRLGYTIHLMGNEYGVFETAIESAQQYTPELAASKNGKVLLNAAFEVAAERAKTPYIAYLNPNIVLTQPIDVEVVGLPSDFVGVGRHWDITVDFLVDFQNKKHLNNFRRHILKSGALHSASDLSYVIMPRDSVLKKLNDVEVHQAGWGNVVVDMAWKLGLPIVELTACFHAINQMTVDEKEKIGQVQMHPSLHDVSHATYRADSNQKIHPRHQQLARMHYDLAKDAEAEVWARAKHAIDFIPHFTYSHFYDDPPLELPSVKSIPKV